MTGVGGGPSIFATENPNLFFTEVTCDKNSIRDVVQLGNLILSIRASQSIPIMCLQRKKSLI